MRKDWLVNISITFGLGWGLGMVFNPANAPLSGLPAGLAAAATGAMTQQLQRRRFLKSSASLRTQVAHLQSKSHELQHNILTTTNEHAQIVTQLDAYNQRRQAAEQHLTALETARKRMTAEAQQIEEKLVELQTEQTELEQSIAQIKVDRQQILDSQRSIQSQLTSSQQELAKKQQELQEVADRLEQLTDEQNEYIAAAEKLAIDRQFSLENHQALQLQLNSSNQQLDWEKQKLQATIDRLQTEEQQCLSITQQLTTEITTLNKTKQNLQLEIDQFQQQLQNSAQIATEYSAVAADAWPEASVSETALPNIAENWQEQFEDSAVRAVFQHLQKYGSVTEAELTQMLEGNPRKARQFALKFEEYLQLVPFQARVEVAASGKRYIKD